MSKTYYVYILASKRNGTLYIGVTNDLARRVWEHREGLVPGFTKNYGVKMLVYYEAFVDITQAIHHEKRLKKYKREWKMNLIQQNNVEWRDLAETPQSHHQVSWPANAGHPGEMSKVYSRAALRKASSDCGRLNNENLDRCGKIINFPPMP
jgi:putative endonuclease